MEFDRSVGDKKPETQCLCGFPDCCLASMRGFEPPTYRLGGGRSILLSYMDRYEISGFLGLPTHRLFFSWWPFLPVLRRRSLYPTELRRQMLIFRGFWPLGLFLTPRILPQNRLENRPFLISRILKMPKWQLAPKLDAIAKKNKRTEFSLGLEWS